ncbi:MFS transporter [Tropicibacter naphthalenivorans]|uniref:MFS transporter, metabolite:H+ symporter (MHS) family protein n=1 Tax=Tropicibacter naphthalenivorans TaxID=441103 RepID=A0A0P1GEH3_9RHOB|nr:MFS transporter [Tropicibacter naphthalenivorans]CUH79842.1 MFS transporter, metabolite:H+ symporter (MHS) family protein [Tropicibacter naphthalenivorans]SMC75588.1 MFS transporter, UMF1 family [Tropicibacter naphthalenivorans]
MISTKKRIWGWAFFDWAQQPYATLGLTFIFAPFFAAVATDMFVAQGMFENDAKVQAQTLWSSAQTVAGLVIAFTAPFLGAWADASGRKRPWIALFTSVAILCAACLWLLQPDGQNLMLALTLFWVGFVFSEAAFNLNNAYLPEFGTDEEIGRISGGATAFGYWGGVVALFIMLLLFAEDDTGLTLIDIKPILGLNPDAREGTRFVGPFIAIWFAVFLIPFLLWTRETPGLQRARPKFGEVLNELWVAVCRVAKQPSTRMFMLASLFYRDALTALYAYGGIYARQVLDWPTVQIGMFGIIAAIAAAILSWVGGIADKRMGPKPVIRFCIFALIFVSTIIVGMSREHLFGIPLPTGSILPDVLFYICGAVIGGAGGALYSASRSLMVRHTDPDHPAEAFGLFAFAGKATAFLAPALITAFGILTNSNQLAFLPVIFLFLLGLFLLRYVHPDGARAA